MRKTLAAVAIMLLAGVGCEPTKPLVTPMQVAEPEFKSEIPVLGQTDWVSFLVGYGYTGGLGSMPVLREDGQMYELQGRPVYFDETRRDEIAAQLPVEYSASRIEVRAYVRVEERQDTNTSIMDAPVTSYYVVIPEKIDHITVSE